MTKNKNQKSIVLQVMAITSFIFLLMLSGWHLAESGFKDIVPIENVEIEGSFENISLNDIRQKIISELDGGYFSVDIDVIRAALLELAWIEDASVRRQWPSGLHIQVVEKNAIAYWGDNAMLSDRGSLFMPLLIKHDKPLPKLNGPAGLHEKVWSFLEKIDKDLNGTGLRVSQITLDNRRAWTLLVTNNESVGSILKLGREDTAIRLHRFVRVFSNNAMLSLENVAVIDMRYPNGFAMKTKLVGKQSTHVNNTGIVQEV